MSRLTVTDVPALALALAARPEPTWLIEGLWPADAYGVVGAEDKAGKTWTILDLAVSVATGTPWLEHFPVVPGPVLAFLGEGGPRGMVRRLDAIVRSRGGTMEDLAELRICCAAPHLGDERDLADIRSELSEHEARLVIIDPLYLAAAGLKGSDLYAMGEVLEHIQLLCADAGAALVITTHWNKTGQGKGSERFTGVGPSAWGRVLGSASVERAATDPDGTSDVLLSWSFRGGEIGDSAFRVRRRVHAGDSKDLSSPLHYAVKVTEVSEGDGGTSPKGLSRSASRVLAVLPGIGAEVTVHDLGDAIALDGHGMPLKRATIERVLGELVAAGHADQATGRWWSTAEPLGIEVDA